MRDGDTQVAGENSDAFNEVVLAHREALAKLTILAEKLEAIGSVGYAGMVIGQKKALLGAMSVILEARGKTKKFCPTGGESHVSR